MRWDRVKRRRETMKQPPLPVYDDVMALVGVEHVKDWLLSLYFTVLRDRSVCEQAGTSFDAVLHKYTLNTRIEGESGTGKSTVAHLYARVLQVRRRRHTSSLLPPFPVRTAPFTAPEPSIPARSSPTDRLPSPSQDLGVLQTRDGSPVVEVDAAQLLAKGVPGLEKLMLDTKGGGGGMVLLEDAPDVVREGVDQRRAEELLGALAQFAAPGTQASIGGGFTVFVVTGNPAAMAALFERNPLLAARFPVAQTIPSFGPADMLEFLHRFLKVRRTVANAHVASSRSLQLHRPHRESDPHDDHVHLEDERHARIAIHRIIAQRDAGTSDQTNIGAVKDLADTVRRRMKLRVDAEQKAGRAPDPQLVVRDDLLGPKLTRVRSFL